VPFCSEERTAAKGDAHAEEVATAQSAGPSDEEQSPAYSSGCRYIDCLRAGQVGREFSRSITGAAYLGGCTMRIATEFKETEV